MPDDPEYMPGLEPDPEDTSEPEPEAKAGETPESPPSTATQSPQPAAPVAAGPLEPVYGEGEWTNAELDTWYYGEYGGDAQYQKDDEFCKDGEFYFDPFWPWKRKLAGKGMPNFRWASPSDKAWFRYGIESLIEDGQLDRPQGAEWTGARDEYYINVKMPDGSTTTEASRWIDWSKWLPIGLGGFGVLGLIMAAGTYVIVSSGSDSSAPDSGEAAAVAADDTETSGSGDSSSSDDSSSGESTAEVDANPCDAVRERQLVLELSSPDVQPTIPKSFSVAFVREDSYESPLLVWSEVPPETTEIAVLVMDLTAERAAAYRLEPETLWWQADTAENAGIPIGATKWTVTGIDPSATLLEGSSSAKPLPPGVTEQDMSGQRVLADGVDLSQRFLGPGLPGETYMFTVFALCEPTLGDPDDLTAGWFKRYSVATGWFISDAAW